jgi:hypothetical protein
MSGEQDQGRYSVLLPADDTKNSANQLVSAVTPDAFPGQVSHSRIYPSLQSDWESFTVSANT